MLRSTGSLKFRKWEIDGANGEFHLHKSHISESARLSRLLMAACLAYIWIVYLGALCEQDGWVCIIHRGDRCDLSLFQLGLRLLDYLLNEGCTIPIAFYISI